MKQLDQFMNLIRFILEKFLMCFMGFMVLTVVWQVFTRFVIHDPSTFTDELSRYLLIWIGILGGAYTFIIKRHLALEIFLMKLPERTAKRFALTTLINLVVVLFTAISFIYGGYTLTKATLLHHQTSPGLAIGTHHLLMGYIYVIIPISGVLIIMYALYDILESFFEIGKPLKEDGVLK